MKTYISLFSSAGVGCYGFKQAGFECVATNELIERRIQVQKYNNKCKYQSGYICGDITKSDTQELLYKEIEFWKKNEGLKRIDVVIATPPCQGMSVANHKKNDHEIIRNSLVVESIKIIKNIQPKFFVFENVPAFIKTICTDLDGVDKQIGDAIEHDLGDNYVFYSKVINFKNYGACSSRMRTIVIGVCRDLIDYVSPFELFPSFRKEKTLYETIGNLPSLNVMGEIDDHDIYHFFRKYPEYMRNWIHDLKEGECAFDNEDDLKKPHQIIDGKIVINQRKNADKYTRQFWGKVGPCVHTRNDQLASQNTIHPKDDRVFSIRELMLMMTVPYDFKWSEFSMEELNNLTIAKKREYLKKEEIKIRQSLGEAVPTTIFNQIANNIVHFGLYDFKNEQKQLKSMKFSSKDELCTFIKENSSNFSPYSLMTLAELTNTNRTANNAYYTNKSLITQILLNVTLPEKDTLRILEPSVGIGNFIFPLIKKYENLNLIIDAVDIDRDSLEIFNIFIEKFKLSDNIKINIINDDFLLHEFNESYDLIIGNPPFDKLSSNDSKLSRYRKNAINKNTTNIASFFLDKSIKIGDNIAIVFPKFLLNIPEFKDTRKYLSPLKVNSIIDFGENGFKGVLIETIAINVNSNLKPNNTLVFSYDENKGYIKKQSYIFDEHLPYWIIYRDDQFDNISKKMNFDVFTVFRDRQITNSLTSDNKKGLWVVKSRNIKDDGDIVHIDNYDSFIDRETASSLSVYSYLDNDNVFLSPNMTYYPRVTRKPKGVLVNGSVAILKLKVDIVVTDEQLNYFSTEEFRLFYKIARNRQTRSLNIDSCSVYFFGLLKSEVESLCG